jgi:hypothetical protein
MLAESTGSKTQLDFLSLAPVTAGDQAGAALRRALRYGRRGKRLGRSPGARPGGRLGRRRSDGGDMGSRSFGQLRWRRPWRRRFGAPRLQFLQRGVIGRRGGALGWTEDDGEAQNGGAQEGQGLGFPRAWATEKERAREKGKTEGERETAATVLIPTQAVGGDGDVHRSGIERRGELHRDAPLSGGRGWSGGVGWA